MGLLKKVKAAGVGEYESCGKVVLAYSGGLDTSVLLGLLQELGVEVVTLTVGLGQDEYAGQGLAAVKAKALSLGASKAYAVNAEEEFISGYVNKAIAANCLYQGNYPCSTALGRPLIAKHLVDVALAEGASAVVHGSTGKGNDYLRFHVSVKSLAPGFKVLAPVRDWSLNRPEEIAYAEEAGIPVAATKKLPYSVDANLWGRSACGGAIEDSAEPVPQDALSWCVSPQDAPDSPGFVKLHFEAGIPVKAEFNGGSFEGVELVKGLNSFAGNHGVGVIDQIEDRTIGLKSREFYECPAATVILRAHKDLELLCLPKELNWLKPSMDQKFAEYCYAALWHSPAMDAVNAFILSTQANVNGWVLLKLFKGNAAVIARGSPTGLYSKVAATYDAGSSFDQLDSKGFANLYALSTVSFAAMGAKAPAGLGAAKKIHPSAALALSGGA
jgi:argininosuccinate synthase